VKKTAKLDSVKKLEEKGVEYRLIELEDRAITVEDVVRFSRSEIRPEDLARVVDYTLVDVAES